MVEIGISPVANGGTGSSDFIPKSRLDFWTPGEFEEAKGQCIGGGFI
jgi:hypothetical protein